MAKSFQLPDGSVISGIPDDASDDDIRHRAIRAFPHLYQKDIEAEKGFIPSFKRSFKESASEMLPEAWSGIKTLAGAEPEQEKPREPYIQPQSFNDLLDKPSWGKAKQYLGESLGSAAPQVAVPVGIAGAAALGGMPALAGAGLAGASMVPGLAHNVYQRALAAGKSKEEATEAARIAAPTEAALYSMPVGRVFGLGRGFKEASDAVATKAAERGWLADKARSVATESPLAAGVGAANEAISQQAAGEDFDPSKIGESAVGMGMLGGIGGIFGGQRGAARNEMAMRNKGYEHLEGMIQAGPEEVARRQDIRERWGARQADREKARLIEEKLEQEEQQRKAAAVAEIEKDIAEKQKGEAKGVIENSLASLLQRKKQVADVVDTSVAKEIAAREKERREAIESSFVEKKASKTSEPTIPEPKKVQKLINNIRDAYKIAHPETQGAEAAPDDYIPLNRVIKKAGIDVKANSTPENIASAAEALRAYAESKKIKNRNDQARKDLYIRTADHLEAQGAANGPIPRTNAARVKNDAGRSESGVGMPAQPEGSTGQSQEIKPAGVAEASHPVGDGTEGEGGVNRPLVREDNLQPGEKVGYEHMGAGKGGPGLREVKDVNKKPEIDEAIAAARKMFEEEAAAKKAAQEKFKEQEKTRTPEEIESDNQDKAKVEHAVTQLDNPYGKYVRDFGKDAMTELAWHRINGMNTGKQEKGWSPGEKWLGKPGKEVGVQTASAAEKWLKDNLSDRGWRNYERVKEHEQTLHAKYLKASSHGPDGKRSERRPRVFATDAEVRKRGMTRTLRAKLGQIEDLVGRLGNLIHAGDEKTAVTRVDDWLDKNKSLIPHLENYLKVKGKDAVALELLDKASENVKTDDEPAKFRGGHPLSRRSIDLLQNGRLDLVLDSIAKFHDNPLLSNIANKLKDFNFKIDVVIIPFEHPKSGVAEKNRFDLGLYRPSDNTIYLNSSILRSGLSDHVLMHEVTHAWTTNIIKAVNDGSVGHLSATQRQAYYSLKNLFEKLQSDYNKQVDAGLHGNKEAPYGLKNLKEFVAEAFSNPEFQEWLHKQPVSSTADSFGGALKNLWSQFVHTIGKLIGIDNALHRTIALSDLLLTKPHPEWFDPEITLPAKASTFDALLKGPRPEFKGGVLGRAFRKTEEVYNSPKGVVRAALSDALVTLENSAFNQRYGITRFLPNKFYTLDKSGNKQVNPKYLLQHAEYSQQMASVSLAGGKMDWSPNGMPKVTKDETVSVGRLMDTIKSFPKEMFGGDNINAFNKIASNLSYEERINALNERKAEAEKAYEIAVAHRRDARKAGNVSQYNKAQQALEISRKILKENYNKPDYITDETIAQAHQAAADPKVAEALAIVKSRNLNNIEFYEKGGMITPELAAEWRANNFYVPLARVMDDVESSGVMRGAGRVVNLRTGKEFKGSERDIDDILGNVIRQEMFMTEAAVRNNAGRRAAQQLEQEGNGEVTQLAGRPPKAENVVQLWDKGEKVYYQVGDKEAYKSFQGLQESMPKFIDQLEKVTSLFREAITLTPDYVARNMFRDSTEAWAMGYTNDGILKTYGGVAAKFAKFLSQADKEVIKGGIHVYDSDISLYGLTGAREHTSIMKEQEALLKRAMSAAGSQGATKNWIDKIDVALNVAHRLAQNATAASELATRERVFQGMKKRTGSEEEAAIGAINVLDWRMRGNAGVLTLAKKLIPFFNTNLQGWYKIYRGLARGDVPGIGVENARRMLLTKLMYMTGAATAYSMLMANDKDYQQVKKQVADNNWLVPVGEGMFMKIPIPFELGVLTKTIPENLIRYMNGDQSGRQMLNDLGNAIGNQMPGLLPQFAKPVLETTMNYDLFSGQPIESDAQRMKEGKERATDSTSETARALGSNALSPLKVDHLLRGYFGSIGTFFTTAVLDPLLSQERFGKTGRPDRAAYETPGLRGFLTNPTQSRTTDLLYELRDLTGKPKATYQDMVKQGRLEEAQEYLQQESPTGKTNAEMIGLGNTVANLTRQLAQMRRAQQQIASSDMPAAEKQRRIQDIKLQTREFTEQVMHLIQPAGVL